MTSVVLLSILVILFLSCTVGEDRARTVRRSIDLDDDESSFITSFDSFLDEAEGTDTSEYWPAGTDPLNEFGLLQSVMVSDMLLQLCIVSGIYVRPPKVYDVYNETLANQTFPKKKDESVRELPEEKNERELPEKKEGRSQLLKELINLLDFSQKREKRQTTVNETASAYNNTLPPLEDWESDPYDLLEDLEDQFTNLCITLFDLRRLNRKLARQKAARNAP